MLKLTLILFILTSLVSVQSFAQIKFFPHPAIEKSGVPAARVNQTTAEAPLELPFWDDFSWAQGLPDTALWLNSETVTTGGYAGLNPPTINVATFDGVDAMGNPYSQQQTYGLIDTLVSRPIDLSSLTPAQAGSVYFSFFWQAEGLSEMPNEDDSLRVQFKSNTDRWYTYWSKKGENMASDVFTHINPVKVEDKAGFTDGETFFHAAFQFRFQAFGNRGGDFDNWHIDYVYLNHGRHANDSIYIDHALTGNPTSLFQPYYAIPFEHLKKDPEKYLARSSVQYYNLSDETHQSNLLFGVVHVLGEGNIVVLDSIHPREGIRDPLPGPFDRRTIEMNPLNVDSLAAFSDSSRLKLETLAYIEAGDTIGDINFLVNDTVRSIVSLDNFYAYDDGTAEMSAGIGKRGAKLAYMFVIEEQDTLTDLQIYFPYSSEAPASSTVWLHIWDELNSESVLHRQTISVVRQGLNNYVNYKLEKNVIVKDTFYIGYEQNVDGYLTIGYDRNNDASDRIFYNVSAQDEWEPYDGDVPGSLMIRPVFNPALVTSVKNPPVANDQVKMYPNPTTGYVTIKGLSLDKIINTTILDGYGRFLKSSSGAEIDLSKYPAGIYLIRIATKNETITRKIVKN